MGKPDRTHSILNSLLLGEGLNERGNNLFVTEDGMCVAAYFYDLATEDLLQVTYTATDYPAMFVVAKKMTLPSLRRHIYRRHGGWRVMKNNLDLTVDKSGCLS